MSRGNILVTGADLPQEAERLLDGYALIYAGPRPSEETLLALIERHDPVGIIVRYGRITARLIEAARSLKAISKYGSGIDTIDVETAQRLGIAVRAAVGVNAASVAEHAIALMLACAKAVTTMNARMHAGYWDKAVHRSSELRGRVLGLVGLGAIGNRVAAIASAIGMRVIGYDPYSKEAPDIVERVSLEKLWAESDVISFHCPLTDETRGMFNSQAIALTKPGVIVVNTARGGVIDEAALLQAVTRGAVSWAGLDSFAQEPPPADHFFFGQERFILSPHIGAVSNEAYVHVGIAASRNLLESLAPAIREVAE